MKNLNDFFKYDAVFFDLDGTLIDTKDMHFDSLKQSLSEFGVDLPKGRLDYPELEGLPSREKLKILSPQFGPIKEHLQQMLDRKQELMEELISKRIHEDPIVTDFLKNLHGKIKLGLCSNARRTTVDKVLELMKISVYFDLVLSADDVQRFKPDPEIYLTACSNLGVLPQNCLVVEDSEVGVLAGQAAGSEVFVVDGPDSFRPLLD